MRESFNSGVTSLLSGLVTSAAMLAHLASTLIPALARRDPLAYNFEVAASTLAGIAILIPGLLSVCLAGALARGQLHAQKRTLAAALVILGLTLPLALSQPLALMVALLALVNITALLCSRTSLSEQPASWR